VGFGTYILFEECYAWGEGRYPFKVQTPGQYIIFRRCVVRWDYSNHDEPYACFANYDRKNAYFQNCIAIDGKDIRSSDYPYNGLQGFLTPNGAIDTHCCGCIVLNFEGAGYYIDDHPIVNVKLENCISWDCKDAGQKDSETYKAWLAYCRNDEDGGPMTFNHCTFGISDLGEGIIGKGGLPNRTIDNSIIYGIKLDADKYAVEGIWASEDYNCFYNNTGGRNRSIGVGAHSIENINPLTNSLLYLTRIEDGSDLAGKANDGNHIGATILKKIGVSGTLYGEPGWDSITDDNLWPFPNEGEMRTDMKAFIKAPGEAFPGSPAMDGNRGFCADGQTLTKYIWEYLGNSVPSEIYPPRAPQNLNILQE